MFDHFRNLCIDDKYINIYIYIYIYMYVCVCVHFAVFEYPPSSFMHSV